MKFTESNHCGSMGSAPRRRTPLRVAGCYLMFGLAWIWMSDSVMTCLKFEGELGFWTAGAKGSAFVLVSAAAIYWLVRREIQVVTEIETLAKAVAEQTSDPVFVKDRQGKYQLLNEAAARLLDRPADELLGRDDVLLLGTHNASPIIEADRRIMATGQSETIEETLTIQSETRTFLTTKSPYRNDQGRIVGVVGISRDISARKQAEESLRISEERLRFFLEHAAAPIAMVDREMRYLFVSRRWMTDYSLGEADIIGRSHYEVFPEIPELWREIHRRCLAGAVESQELDRFNRRDGSVQWIRWEIRPWFQSNGAVGGLIMFSEDVTRQKIANDELRESEERFRRLVEASAAIVWTTDDRGVPREDSPSWRSFTGWRKEEFLDSQNLILAFHPDDHELLRERWRRAIETASTFEAEVRLRRHSGEYRHMACRAVPIQNSDGSIRRWVGMNSDITHRKLTETALRASEERLRLAQEAGRVGIFDWDTVSGHSIWTGVQESIYGLLPTTFKGRHEDWVDRIHPDDREWILERTRVCFRERKLEDSFDYRIVLPDGDVRWVTNRCRISYDANGQAVRMLGTTVDITERQRLEQQLRQAQKMEAIGLLAGGVAHDFNNLLTVINGYSEFIIEGLDVDNPLREQVETIRTAGERAARLTEQLLAFSRKAMVVPRRLDLNALVVESGKLLRRIIGEDIVLTTKLDPSLRPIHADQGQIEQVLMNLFVNARDAMPAGGRIVVESRNVLLGEDDLIGEPDLSPGQYVRLSVADSGVGIPEDERVRIFEPFFTTKAMGKGTGLGLSVAHGVVKQAGGVIRVTSETGRGSTFTMHFPANAAEPATDAPESKASSRGNETVLLVEDESSVRSMARLALRSNGYSVLEANSGVEALRIAAENIDRIDLLLTDVVMPGMSGRELADQLGPQFAEMKVLYMSGYTDDAIIRHGVADAGRAFIQKPFGPADLAQRVRSVLDGGPVISAKVQDSSEVDLSPLEVSPDVNDSFPDVDEKSLLES